jgi:spore maturation protein CgeB
MKVVAALLRYDYGIKDRGISLERLCFFPAIERVVESAVPFWLEDNGYPEDIPLLQNRLLRFIDSEKPDVVFFILMNSEITLETITQLSKRYITVNWFCDDQWRFKDFARVVAPALTFAATTDKYSLEKYRELGCSNIIHSQWAAIEYREDIQFDEPQYENDICFIGGLNPTRKWIVQYIQDNGFHVDCYGSGWPNGRVSFRQIKDVTFRSKINLNLSNSFSLDFRFLEYLQKMRFEPTSMSRKQRILNSFFPRISSRRVLKEALNTFNSSKNVEQIKARNFEIPAFGGFELTQYCLEIEDYFEIGKEIAIFSNIDDLLRQIDYYLTHDRERESLRRAGYIRARDYTYENRMRKLFDEIRITSRIN